MKQTTIIRIEHPIDGKGLFNSADENDIDRIDKHSNSQIIYDRHFDHSKFPNYGSDLELIKHIDRETLRNYHFAFLSLDQLQEALTKEELKEFIEVLGFKVLMLDVTDYFESKFQVVFNKESIITSKDISFMFL